MQRRGANETGERGGDALVDRSGSVQRGARLHDWKLVRQIRECGPITHWQTQRGLLLVRLPVELVAEPASSPAFMRDAEVFATLSHPGIASVLDWAIAGEFAYLVLDAPRGKTFGELAKLAAVSPEVIARIVFDALDALESAHAAGAVFGELGPDSVVVTEEGRVCLLPSCSHAGAAAADDLAALAELIGNASPALAALAVRADSATTLREQLRASHPLAERSDVIRFVRQARAPRPRAPVQRLSRLSLVASVETPPLGVWLGPPIESEGREWSASMSFAATPLQASPTPRVLPRVRSLGVAGLTLSSVLLAGSVALVLLAWTRLAFEPEPAHAAAPTAAFVQRPAPSTAARIASSAPAPPRSAAAPVESASRAAKSASARTPRAKRNAALPAPRVAADSGRYTFVPTGL